MTVENLFLRQALLVVVKKVVRVAGPHISLKGVSKIPPLSFSVVPEADPATFWHKL